MVFGTASTCVTLRFPLGINGAASRFNTYCFSRRFVFRSSNQYRTNEELRKTNPFCEFRFKCVCIANGELLVPDLSPSTLTSCYKTKSLSQPLVIYCYFHLFLCVYMNLLQTIDSFLRRTPFPISTCLSPQRPVAIGPTAEACN